MKLRLLYIVPLIIGVCFFLAYSISGSTVAEDGTLVENFGFIPLGYLFLLIGIVTLIIVEIKVFYNNKR